MKKDFIKFITGFAVGIFISVAGSAFALGTPPLPYGQGGTATSTAQAGRLRAMGTTADQGVPTTTASCSSGVSCTTFTVVGSSPISIAGSGVSAFPFPPTTNFGAGANATGTPVWFQAGVQASTTSQFSTANFYTDTIDDGFKIITTAVNHAAQIQETGTNGVHLSFANANTGYTTTSGTNFGIQSDGTSVIRNFGNFGLKFFSNNTSQILTILPTGQMGIGTTTPWGQTSASSTSAYPTLAIEQHSTGPAAVFLGGNVGIGTTTPYKQFAVGGDVVIGASTAGGTLGDLYLPKLETSAGSLVAIDSTGKVISTTTNPLVVGSITATSTATSTYAGNLSIQSIDVNPYNTPGFTITASTTAAVPFFTGTSTVQLPSAFVNQKIDQSQCYTNTGTINVWFGNGIASTTMFNASTTQGVMTYASNNARSLGQKWYVGYGTAASSVSELTCTLRIENTSY